MSGETFQAMRAAVQTLSQSGRHTAARQRCEQYCQEQPDDPQGWFMLATMQAQQGRADEAVDCYGKVLLQAPRHVQTLFNLGGLYGLRGECERAIDCFRQVLSLRPDYPEAHYFIANALRSLGRFADAEAAYREALRLWPGYGRAYMALSDIKKFTPDDQDLPVMEDLLRQADLDAEQQAYLAFGLAKAYDDLQQYAVAFDTLREANRLYRGTFRYDVRNDATLFDAIKAAFPDAEFFQQRAACGVRDRTPIFIVGMLRSGTSLVEQILSSHPDVYGAGELDELGPVILGGESRLAGNRFPGRVGDLTPVDIEGFARRYLARLQVLAGDAARVTDKNPTNFVLLGMIRLLFPQAKIIHCRRDPVDTCLSIFRKLFTGLHRYAYDLEELGRYYRLYRQLMAHWHQVLPGVIHDLDYEALIADQEGQTRRLLAYCDLGWDDNCLTFYRNHRPVQTASVGQVRQPIYRSSIRQWRHYEPYLRPLLDTLGAP